MKKSTTPFSSHKYVKTPLRFCNLLYKGFRVALPLIFLAASSIALAQKPMATKVSDNSSKLPMNGPVLIDTKMDTSSYFISCVNSNGDKFKVYGDGTVYARAFKVTAHNFPDYVFDKEYDLMSLSNLEDFIDQHKHLPEIPTAKEIEENKLDVGEMQLLQMQKIEEIFLHLIQLQKENESLKARVVELEGNAK